MKFSAILLASLAVSTQAVTVTDYEDSDRYPFGSPYSTSELAAHDRELKDIKSVIGKKQATVQVQKAPVEVVEKKQETKKAPEKKESKKKVEQQSHMSIEEREYNDDIDDHGKTREECSRSITETSPSEHKNHHHCR